MFTNWISRSIDHFIYLYFRRNYILYTYVCSLYVSYLTNNADITDTLLKKHISYVLFTFFLGLCVNSVEGHSQGHIIWTLTTEHILGNETIRCDI